MHFLDFTSSFGCTEYITRLENHHFRRGREPSTISSHLQPGLCSSNSLFEYKVTDKHPSLWIYPKKLWSAAPLKAHPSTSCWFGLLERPPSPTPSSLSWTIELKLPIHYMWRSLTQSSTLLRKTATLYGNFRITASATLLISIFNAAAQCEELYAVHCMFVKTLCTFK